MARKFIFGRTDKPASSAADENQVFALQKMQVGLDAKTKMININYDKLASNLKQAEGSVAVANASEAIGKIAKAHFGKAMREWSTASGSSTTIFYSADGTPAFISIETRHKLETLVVSTFCLPDAVHKEIENVIGR